MKQISYSAVVLDEESVNRLKWEYGDKMPSNWEWIGHHMTIKMGELPSDMKQYIGQEVDLLVNAIGMDQRVLAVSVDDNGLSFNDVPHITLAVNRKGGGKPFHSNEIQRWDKLGNRISVTGHVTEIGRNR